MKKMLTSIFAVVLVLQSTQAQVVIRMEMPEQSSEPVSAFALFDDLLPLDMPVILSPLGYDISGGTPPYIFKWTENDITISEDSIVVLTASEGNSYDLIITDQNNCSVTLPVLTETSANVGTDPAERNIVTAYYYPAGRSIIIRFNEPVSKDVCIKLFDYNGIKHYEKYINEDIIIPLNMPKGFCFLDIRGEEFHQITKIIIR